MTYVKQRIGSADKPPAVPGVQGNNSGAGIQRSKDQQGTLTKGGHTDTSASAAMEDQICDPLERSGGFHADQLCAADGNHMVHYGKNQERCRAQRSCADCLSAPGGALHVYRRIHRPLQPQNGLDGSGSVYCGLQPCPVHCRAFCADTNRAAPDAGRHALCWDGVSLSRLAGRDAAHCSKGTPDQIRRVRQRV